MLGLDGHVDTAEIPDMTTETADPIDLDEAVVTTGVTITSK